MVRKIMLSTVTKTATEEFGIHYRLGTRLYNTTFATLFGTKPVVVMHVYNELVRTGLLPEKYEVKYILWTLHFLKDYGKELCIALRVGVSHNTYMKWVWFTIDLMQNIKVVRENSLKCG
jgi:hypothetical protein